MIILFLRIEVISIGDLNRTFKDARHLRTKPFIKTRVDIKTEMININTVGTKLNVTKAAISFALRLLSENFTLPFDEDLYDIAEDHEEQK